MIVGWHAGKVRKNAIERNRGTKARYAVSIKDSNSTCKATAQARKSRALRSDGQIEVEVFPNIRTGDMEDEEEEEEEEESLLLRPPDSLSLWRDFLVGSERGKKK